MLKPLKLVLLVLIATLVIFLSHESQPSSSSYHNDVAAELPLKELCPKNVVLDQSRFDYKQFLEGFPHSGSQCRLEKYTKERVVQCLDSITANRHPISSAANNNSRSSEKPLLRFIFMGDSRMRQHFVNFLKVCIFFITHVKKKFE